MKRTSDNGFEIALAIILIILVIIAGVYRQTKAQDIVHTHFAPTCIETLSPVHYRLHFGYTSSGVEIFTVSTVANVSIGDTITTAQGTYALGYLDAYTADSMLDNLVTFTGANDSSVLHMNTWQITTPCEGSSVSPDATPEPEPSTITDDCPAWAINGATGERFCMWSLPKAGSWQ